MKLRVWHRTHYTYDAPVTNSFGLAHVSPRDLPHQRVLEHDVRVTPEPSDARPDRDHFDNHSLYFHVTEPHTALEVWSESIVDTAQPTHAAETLATPWEQCRPQHRLDAPDAWEAVDFSLESRLVAQPEAVREYAAVSLTPGRPIGEAMDDLVTRIHADFEYDPSATTVSTGIEEVMSRRAGVCQDFAHVFLSCLRTHGLAGRYVSGYLATSPPPGKERVVGADASHAWAAAWLPDGTWLALDPTNDQRVNDRYVTAAWGRDYKDVPPVKGIIYTDATSTRLEVSVDVAPID